MKNNRNKTDKNKLPALKSSDIVFYASAEGNVRVEVVFGAETFWLTQKRMAELFGVNVPAISKHLKNTFESGELDEKAVISKMETTADDGKRYLTTFYNLDAVIAVGYRINSVQATKFRIWATKTLKEFIIKGFVLDDERLKQGKRFGKDYFDELLERIREIRASERRFYQKITDIYALSADYDKNALVTKDFFATVQNKLHWAITGKTAAEIIYTNADAKKAYMGLITWKHMPDNKILKSDVIIAKNYLSEIHIRELNGIISAYLDLAENRANRQLLTKMEDWKKILEQFLKVASYPILRDKGKVSMLEAKLKAEAEYEVYRVKQDKDYISDFDKEIKRFEGKQK